MELIFKNPFFPWEFSNKFHQKKTFNLTPKECQYPLLKSPWDAPKIFSSPYIQIPTGGVRSSKAVVLWFGPQNTEMHRIFSPTNFRREVIGTHCANASMTRSRRQGTSEGQRVTVAAGPFSSRLTISVSDYIINGHQKYMMDLDMKDLCSEFCCVQVLVKDYAVILPIFSFIDYYLCSPAAH